ncbi:MAG: molybdopterin molybdenumtransferase MoeA [Piscirickettsiaceae bacterium]|nr:MAG: molybdopterin molybdenumtransferase MoeA [Piscirickettsiaceae bacterium]PCI68084.1 MAG: molybdopterin molybdenumtransferase MoeA [Piscirickettsiaceae bacterium]
MTDACATPGLLTLKQALAEIFTALPTAQRYERLSLKKVRNRIAFEDIQSAIDVPSFKNSSMDGYALLAEDDYTKPLTVVGTSWAGKPFTGEIKPGECIRIFTGAYLPDACNCVVMQENVARSDNIININNNPQLFDNIRNIGDDTKKNQTIIAKGKLLTAADIGLLASCGIADIPVHTTLKVGFFSTGDELVSIGSQAALGQIFDSNRYTLHALVEQAGCTPIDMGVIADNPEAVETALLSAATQCDVIITSGGVSVGEADFITEVLANIGKINLWKIAIKPGKPLVFGSIKKAAFFGLPGNPVSVMVTFQQVVLPALQKMMGLNHQHTPITLQANASETIYKQPGRMEFQRGFVENINGLLIVSSTGGQGSHMLSSMSAANCFIVLEQDAGNVDKGQTVTIQLLGNSL